MNNFFEHYADITALAITLLLPLILTVLMKKKAGRKARAVPSYFLLFGPCGILAFIFFHLFENSYRAVSSAIAGSFIYNFHFYSLILTGVTVALVGYFFLRVCWAKCVLEKNNNRNVFAMMILVAVVTAPLVPLTPIAAVPCICSIFSLLGLPFVRRKSRAVPVISSESEAA